MFNELYTTIFTYIFIIGAAQAAQLSIVLFRKKENQLANRVLAFAMALFMIDLLQGVFFISGHFLNLPQTMAISNTFPYLYGPLIYVYILLLTGASHSIKQYWYHAIPFLLVQVYGLLFFYFESPQFYEAIITPGAEQTWHFRLIGNLIPVSGYVYTILSLIATFKYRKKIKQTFSNIEKINLSWLMYIVGGTAIIWTIVVLSYIFVFLSGDDPQFGAAIYLSMAVFNFLLGYKSLRQPQIIYVEPEKEEEEKHESYKKSGLSEDLVKDSIIKLNHVMLEQKPHLNSELKLPELAEMVGVSNHNLSEIINRHMGQTFYDYVNAFRVEEVKKLIQEDKESRFTILALGYDAGFSSKSAFYTAFKKATGITPAQFRNDARLHSNAS